MDKLKKLVESCNYASDQLGTIASKTDDQTASAIDEIAECLMLSVLAIRHEDEFLALRNDDSVFANQYGKDELNEWLMDYFINK